MTTLTYSHNIGNLIFTDDSFSFRGVKVMPKTNFHYFNDKHKCLNPIKIENQNFITFTKPRVLKYIEQFENNEDVIGYTVENYEIPIHILGESYSVKSDIEVMFKSNSYANCTTETIPRSIFIFCMNEMKYKSFQALTESELDKLSSIHKNVYNNNLEIVSYELELITQIYNWCKKQNAEMYIDYGNDDLEVITNPNESLIN